MSAMRPPTRYPSSPPQVAAILRDIINTQNYQITFMKGFLGDAGYPEEAEECANEDGDGDDSVPTWAIAVMAVLGVLCLALLATVAFKSKGSGSNVQGAAK